MTSVYINDIYKYIHSYTDPIFFLHFLFHFSISQKHLIFNILHYTWLAQIFRSKMCLCIYNWSWDIQRQSCFSLFFYLSVGASLTTDKWKIWEKDWKNFGTRFSSQADAGYLYLYLSCIFILFLCLFVSLKSTFTRLVC